MSGQKKELILGSSSPRHRVLLEELEFPFQAVDSGVSEGVHPSVSPSDVVQSQAEKKARAVAETCRDHLVIGADTIVVLKKSILGKPSPRVMLHSACLRICGARSIPLSRVLP